MEQGEEFGECGSLEASLGAWVIDLNTWRSPHSHRREARKSCSNRSGSAKESPYVWRRSRFGRARHVFVNENSIESTIGALNRDDCRPYSTRGAWKHVCSAGTSMDPSVNWERQADRKRVKGPPRSRGLPAFDEDETPRHFRASASANIALPISRDRALAVDSLASSSQPDGNNRRASSRLNTPLELQPYGFAVEGGIPLFAAVG